MKDDLSTPKECPCGNQQDIFNFKGYRSETEGIVSNDFYVCGCCGHNFNEPIHTMNGFETWISAEDWILKSDIWK